MGSMWCWGVKADPTSDYMHCAAVFIWKVESLLDRRRSDRSVWWRRHEKPERVVGARMQFADIDGLGASPPRLPVAVVTGFDDGTYSARFEDPLEFHGQLVHSMTFRARHLGHPVSRVRKGSVLAINATLDSGDRFIALINPA